jgi:ABC-type sugar transport system substrate-binding protein
MLAAAATAPALAEDKTYTIYLSNGLIGNDWLQQMQRSAEVAVTKPPLAGRVDLHIETVENSAQAQINSLNNIIAAKPDALIVHAASLDALNPTIEAGRARTSSTPTGTASTTTSRPGSPTCSAARARSSSTADCQARPSRKPPTRRSSV